MIEEEKRKNAFEAAKAALEKLFQKYPPSAKQMVTPIVEQIAFTAFCRGKVHLHRRREKEKALCQKRSGIQDAEQSIPILYDNFDGDIGERNGEMVIESTPILYDNSDEDIGECNDEMIVENEQSIDNVGNTIYEIVAEDEQNHENDNIANGDTASVGDLVTKNSETSIYDYFYKISAILADNAYFRGKIRASRAQKSAKVRCSM